MTYSVTTGNSNLNKLRTRILSNEKTARQNMQEFLEAAVLHAKETSDCSAIGRLFNSLGKRPSINVAAARICIEDLTSIRIVSKGKKGSKEIKSVLAKDDNKDAIQVTAGMVDAVKSADWASYQRDVPDTVMTVEDLQGRIDNVISFMDKLIKGEAKGKSIVEGDVDAVRALRTSLIQATKPVNYDTLTDTTETSDDTDAVTAMAASVAA